MALPRPVPFELTRFSLLEHLHQDFPLAVLIAPAGYGKTTLLAQFAKAQQSKQHHVVWLTLQEDDADPQHLARRLKERLEALGLSVNGEKSADLARALAGSSTPVTLILDVCEHVSEQSGKWLEALLSQLGEDYKVVLAGRVFPRTFPLARYAAAGKLCLLELEVLRFSESEVRQYLETRDIKPTEAIRQLEGWPAGLALSSSVSSKSPRRFEAGDLMLELLAQLPLTFQEVLPQLAVLEVWSEEEAQELGITLPKTWLHHLQRSGLPLAPLSKRSFRPHQLLLDALEKHLSQTPELYKHLYQRSAEKLLGEQRPLEATKHFLKANNLQRALSVAAPFGKELLTKRKFVLLRQLWELFAFDDLPDAARFQLAKAWIETREFEKGASLLETLIG
jgi:LuxR family maltose regulon positive regulatory protein